MVAGKKDGFQMVITKKKKKTTEHVYNSITPITTKKKNLNDILRFVLVMKLLACDR